MDIGLEAAGFEPVACLENDHWARETLEANRPEWFLWGSGDVHDAAERLRPSDLGMEPRELDLLAGGPPCQPFSAAAQWAEGGRQGMDDLRATTVHALVAMVDAFLPAAVLIENVQGFIKGRNSAAKYLEDEFGKINSRHGTQYSIQWRLVNAADHGVPQNRKRVIVVAFRENVSWTWPDATHLERPVTAGEALRSVRNIDVPKAKGKWAQLLPSIPEGGNYQWLTALGGGEEVFGYRTKYWNFLLKLSPTTPSWTLSASPGPSTGPFHWENRPLSSAESMRLQTFPADWKLSGDFRTQVKLVGNATPPLLAEIFGRQIRDLVLGDEKPIDGSMTLSIDRSDVSISAKTAPEPVPEEFRRLIGSKQAHPGSGKGPAPRLVSPIDNGPSLIPEISRMNEALYD